MDHSEALITVRVVTDGGQGERVQLGTQTPPQSEMKGKEGESQFRLSSQRKIVAKQTVATMTDLTTVDWEGQPLRAESPRERRERRQRKARGMVLRDDDLFIEECEDSQGEGEILEAPTQDSTHLELAAV